MSNKHKGNHAEQLTVNFLSQQGLEVVTRNYRIDGGEIDIIAKDGARFVFIEVKYRADEGFAAALEQVSWAQCQRVRFTAQHYLLVQQLDQHQLALRFDIITVTGNDMTIDWLKDAF